MKNNLIKYGVWIPIIGGIVMLFATKFGKYKTIYFAGEAWEAYQAISFYVIGILFFVIFKNEII